MASLLLNWVILCAISIIMMKDKINICAWNMNHVNLRCAKPYLNILMNEYSILAISEHGLYNCELYRLDDINPNFKSLAKSSSALKDANFGKAPGHGGCALLWHTDLSNYVRPLPRVGSDRICVIQMSVKNIINCIIISIYM